MPGLNVESPLFRCALGIVVLAISARVSSASVIYEYRESSSTAVIGTLEIAAPPASAGGPWSTVDLSDLVSLLLDDSVFGLGSGDLLSGGGVVNVAGISSADGTQLDAGGVGITFPTILPPNPFDPAIDRTLVLGFDAAAGLDVVQLATFLTFPDGSVVIGDLFVDGNWTAAPIAAIPEPGTFTLLGIGLAAAGRSALRRRRGTTRHAA